MSGVNKVILVGNLGVDPEIRTLESGVKVANFTMATNETYKDKNGDRQEKTEWHRIVLWRGLAEIAEKYLQKGKQIYLEGRLRTRQWKDKDDNTKYTTEVVGDNMVMLSGKPPVDSSENSPPPAEENTSEQGSQAAGVEDDLPF